VRGGPSKAGRFWLARVNKYEIELWDTTGAILQRLVMRQSWFREWSSLPSLMPWREAWPAQIVGIQEAPDGLLWVATWLARRDWRPAPADSSVSESAATDYLDTVIDVIDPTAGRLVATTTLTGTYALTLNVLYLASYRIGPDGEYTWALWKPTLLR
jgi:hypothetical protein